MYQIKQGDCLELMGSIPDKSIDMILADLPYGTTACSWDTIIPFEPLWDNYKRIIKPNGCIALFGSEPFSSHLRLSNIKQYKYDWYWNKDKSGNPLVAKYRPLGVYETVSIFGNSINYYPIMTKAISENIRPISENGHAKKSDFLNSIKSGKFLHSKNYDGSLRFPKNELYVPNMNEECNSLSRVHPTQKPVLLLEYLIKTYTVENETVLDNTMGSGSTGVACIRTNRNFIGFEKDSNYYKIAEKRILDEIDKTALFNIEKAS